MTLKVFKRYTSAARAANGAPFVRVDDLYIVGDIDGALSRIEVLQDGRVGGCVTPKHLVRLGNANHAAATELSRQGMVEIVWGAK
jgi:hypothetical protein